MIAGAVAQYLAAQGLTETHVGSLGLDFTGARSFAVNDEPGEDTATLDATRWYDARLQVRCRAGDAIDAVEGLQAAYDLLRALGGQTLTWSNPKGGSRGYVIGVVRTITRPSWFVSPTPGEVASCNLRLQVKAA